MSHKENESILPKLFDYSKMVWRKFRMKNKPPLSRLIMAAAGIFMIYLFFSGASGFIKIGRMHLEKERLIKENQELLTRLVDAEITKKRLQTDMKFIEHIARTRHFMSRPGEVIYRFKK